MLRVGGRHPNENMNSTLYTLHSTLYTLHSTTTEAHESANPASETQRVFCFLAFITIGQRDHVSPCHLQE